jgi:hypothetical protein
MSGRRLGDGMVVEGVREQGSAGLEASHAAAKLRAEPVEVVGTHLINCDQHDQRGAAGRPGRLLSGGMGGGEQDGGASQYQSIHGQQCDLWTEFRQAMAQRPRSYNY